MFRSGKSVEFGWGWKWEESISPCNFYRCGTFDALSDVLAGYKLYMEPNFPDPLFFFFPSEYIIERPTCPLSI